MSDRDAVITGIGLISCLGEGLAAHRAALADFHPVVDAASYAPWPVHPLAPVEWDRQIPKRQDQRQMEPWQRIGTYAAGLALESAGVKGDTALLERMHMIVAAGGGERDEAVDAAILSGMPAAQNPAAFLNEHLMGDLRPTLFLAQLSNLLAGNISIVHGVVGSSRTFMGEEASGADAVRIAVARIAAGQGEQFLVGGSYNAQRHDVILQYEMGGLMAHGDWSGVWSRQQAGGGMVLGSLGCFLVIESRAHAAARGAPVLARIAHVATGRCRRAPGEATAVAAGQWEAIAPALSPRAAVLSGASGGAGITAEEQNFLAATGLPVRGMSSALGHAMEPSFIANLAIAADVVGCKALFAPLDAGEAAAAGPVDQVVVTSWGHRRGEALALVTSG